MKLWIFFCFAKKKNNWNWNAIVGMTIPIWMLIRFLIGFTNTRSFSNEKLRATDSKKFGITPRFPLHKVRMYELWHIKCWWERERDSVVCRMLPTHCLCQCILVWYKHSQYANNYLRSKLRRIRRNATSTIKTCFELLRVWFGTP